LVFVLIEITLYTNVTPKLKTMINTANKTHHIHPLRNFQAHS
jgi:hypothetical protein